MDAGLILRPNCFSYSPSDKRPKAKLDFAFVFNSCFLKPRSPLPKAKTGEGHTQCIEPLCSHLCCIHFRNPDSSSDESDSLIHSPQNPSFLKNLRIFSIAEQLLIECEFSIAGRQFESAPFSIGKVQWMREPYRAEG